MNTQLCRACPRGLFNDAISNPACLCAEISGFTTRSWRGEEFWYCRVVRRGSNKFLRCRFAGFQKRNWHIFKAEGSFNLPASPYHCLIASSSSLLKSHQDQKEAGCYGRGLLYVRTRLGAAIRESRPERNNVLGACAKEAKRKRASPTRERSYPDS